MSISEIDFNAVPPIIMVIVAVLGVVFVALRFNREDGTAVVTQQSTLLSDMRSLNDELQESLNRTREERDVLLVKMKELEGKVEACTAEINLLRTQLTER